MAIYQPRWSNRNGATIDNTSMSKLAAIRVAELEPYVAKVQDELEKTRTSLAQYEREVAKAEGQLAYWSAMKEIAREIDGRLAEETEDGNATEVG